MLHQRGHSLDMNAQLSGILEGNLISVRTSNKSRKGSVFTLLRRLCKTREYQMLLFIF